MSDEPDSLLSKYVPANGIEYPMVEVASDRELKVRGFPTIYLVDGDGKVVAAGHSVPTREQVEKALETVRLLPPMPEGAAFRKIASAVEASDWKDAFEALEKLEKVDQVDALSAEESACVRKLRELFDARRAAVRERIENARKGPDYLAAEEKLERIEKDWKGLPEGDLAEQALEDFGKDKAIQREMRAMKTFRSLEKKFGDLGSSSQRERAVRTLEQFLKTYEGTHAAAEAEALKGRIARGR